jgi:hypothetical protein
VPPKPPAWADDSYRKKAAGAVWHSARREAGFVFSPLASCAIVDYAPLRVVPVSNRGLREESENATVIRPR